MKVGRFCVLTKTFCPSKKPRSFLSRHFFELSFLSLLLFSNLIIIIHAEETSSSGDSKQQPLTTNSSTTTKPNESVNHSANDTQSTTSTSSSASSTSSPTSNHEHHPMEHYEPRDQMGKLLPSHGRRHPMTKYYRVPPPQTNKPYRLRPYVPPPPNHYHYHTPYVPHELHAHSYGPYPPSYPYPPYPYPSAPYYDDHVHYFSHRFRTPTEIQLFEPPVITIRSGVDPKGGKLVSNLVNRASKAVQNLIEHTRNRSRPSLVKFMSERRRSGGGVSRLFPRVRERLSNRLDRIESRSSTLPTSTTTSSSATTLSSTSPINTNTNINNNNSPDGDKIEYSESRIHNETDYRNSVNHKTAADLNNNKAIMTKTIDYEQEGKKLRQDIIEKVGHLQTILTTAFEVSKERRDIILSRLLRNTNNRLERAKLRADQILSEPSTSELAVKTLHHINNGINSMNSFMQSLLNRINISINVQMKNPNQNTNNNDDHNHNNAADIINGTASQLDQQQQQHPFEQEKLIEQRK